MWAGDNRSTWDALALSLPMFMTLGLSGEPFVGSDVGGFIGRADAELLVRWYEVGFLTPFCRNHADMASPDHEPWRYGTYYEDIIRRYLPRYVLITEAKRSDVKMADAFTLNSGSIVAMDRGYNDYGLFFKWTREEIYFVTRLKENAAYEVVEECEVPQDRNIRSDQLIRLTGVQAQKDCPCLLRRVTVWDPVNEREIVLLTNLTAFGATTIAAIYKDRWEIELFFKALKQNLKVKSFVGTSENALRIQIWTALIAILLLKWLHHLSKAKWSLSNLASMLRLNLFTYRDLRKWLDDPFETPPLLPESQQLTLALA